MNARQSHRGLPRYWSERTLGQIVSQLFCRAHKSNGNKMVQIHSFKTANPNQHGVSERCASNMGFVLFEIPRMTASLSSKIINWAGRKLSEYWREHGQSYQMTRFRQNDNVHDARYFDAYGYSGNKNVKMSQDTVPYLYCWYSFHS